MFVSALFKVYRPNSFILILAHVMVTCCLARLYKAQFYRAWPGFLSCFHDRHGPSPFILISWIWNGSEKKPCQGSRTIEYVSPVLNSKQFGETSVAFEAAERNATQSHNIDSWIEAGAATTILLVKPSMRSEKLFSRSTGKIKTAPEPSTDFCRLLQCII